MFAAPRGSWCQFLEGAVTTRSNESLEQKLLPGALQPAAVETLTAAAITGPTADRCGTYLVCQCQEASPEAQVAAHRSPAEAEENNSLAAAWRSLLEVVHQRAAGIDPVAVAQTGPAGPLEAVAPSTAAGSEPEQASQREVRRQRR